MQSDLAILSKTLGEQTRLRSPNSVNSTTSNVEGAHSTQDGSVGYTVSGSDSTHLIRVILRSKYLDLGKERGATRKTKKGPERALAVQEILDLWESWLYRDRHFLVKPCELPNGAHQLDVPRTISNTWCVIEALTKYCRT